MKLIGIAKPTKVVQSRVKGYIRDVMGVVDFAQLLGAAGHLACPNCNHPWFEVEVDGVHTTFGCKNCGYVSKAVFPNQLDQQGFLKCPDCAKKQKENRWMAVIFSNDIVCVGCKNCRWELRSSLVLEPGKILT